MEATDFQAARVHYPAKSGFIVLLDALGVRTLSPGEIDLFLEQRRVVLQALSDILPILRKRRLERRNDNAVSLPHTLVFGDTIALIWPSEPCDPYTWLNELLEFSSAIGYVLAIGFIMGLKLRGSVAYGEFVFGDGVIIGPAVADAAAWYEKAQLIGVVATPSTHDYITNLLDSNKVEFESAGIEKRLLSVLQEEIRIHWPVYSVPMKKGENKMICLNWIYSLILLAPLITDITKEHVSTFFQRHLASMPRPVDAEGKFKNTELLYSFCVKHIAEIETRCFPVAVQRAIASDTPLPWFDAFFQRYQKRYKNA